MKTASRILRAAAVGVWRFAVGDTPEFLVVVLVVVGFALAVHGVHLAVVIGLPVIVALVLISSVVHGRSSSRHGP